MFYIKNFNFQINSNYEFIYYIIKLYISVEFNVSFNMLQTEECTTYKSTGNIICFRFLVVA